MKGVKRWDAGTLVLRFVVSCGAGGGGCCIRRKHRGRLFWLVQLRCDERRGLMDIVEMQGADAPVLWFVAALDGEDCW